MKNKILSGILAVVLSMTFLNGNVTKAEEVDTGSYLTDEQIIKLNEALEVMVEEANENLAQGNENFVISKKVSGIEEPITLGFSSDALPTNAKLSTKSISPLAATAVTAKEYSAYVGYSGVGFDFSHVLYGDFTYSGGKVKGATKNVALNGPFYEKTHDTPPIDKLDPSVWEVKSTGTFKGLKFFKEYKTYLVVRLLGSGHYRIEDARMTG